MLYHITTRGFYKVYHMTTQGFYKVYGDVFRRIAEEESQYAVEGEQRLPDFGTFSVSDAASSHKVILLQPSLCVQVSPQATMKR